MNERQKNVAQHCNGVLTSRQIAVLANDGLKYVQEVMLKFDLPRRTRGSAFGALNGAYIGGRSIDRDGYVLTSAPTGHPHARMMKDRNTGRALEHRLAVEKKIGRYLHPSEVVDHIDGLTLHNHPSNLRLFASNAEHLKKTIQGGKHCVSALGVAILQLSRADRKAAQPVNRYDSMKKCGDARLRQILLAALQLGTSSPYLLGSSHHLKTSGISDLSHSNLKHELALLCQRWELALPQSIF